MPLQRVFLHWSRPALATAADFLLERNAAERLVDLERTIVAVPGGRAGRRLLEILVDRAEREGRPLVPPRIVTVGRLPELLYEPKKPFANGFTQQLAWIEALRRLPPERLGRLVRQPPDDGDLFAWLALGEMLSSLHRELAADALDFSDVARLGSASEPAAALPPEEVDRWRLLADVQSEYLAILDRQNLWDLQTARLYAIRHREFQAGGDIVLVGALDLNGAQRAMLDQVADHVTALVFAPESLAERFDAHGCLVPEAWQEAVIDGVYERTEIVDGPGDQADAVARALASFEDRYSPEEITIGVPDDRLVPYLQQRMEECGVPARYGVGTNAARSGPGRLLRAVADWLDGRRFRGLSNLLRHPAVEQWLREEGVRGDWLSELDEYYARHLPSRITGAWLGALKPGRGVGEAYRKLESLLRDLSRDRRPPGAWGEPIVALLLKVCGGKPLDLNDPAQAGVVRACEKVRNVLEQFRQVPEALSPQVDGPLALRLLLRALESELIPAAADQAAVELLGWLELPLDDAPALVLTGFNEGVVPSSRNADVFLPNELRRRLNLEDNDRRYARDACALSHLAASRRDLRIIAGRRTAENDPLVPSRLLFACGEEELARRAFEVFSTERRRPPRVVFPGSLQPGSERGAFRIPPPAPLDQPVTSMRVTEFRDYLACPYRYYLKQRLSLRSLSVLWEELDGGTFGALLHDVLDRFGREPSVRSTCKADEIRDFLFAALDQTVQDAYGDEPLPAVAVQREQARHRLKAFADWQAGWSREGWRVVCSETGVEGDRAALPVDGEAMPLRGRIDRIDLRETRDGGLECAVLDYKTGDRGDDPMKKHRQSDGRWVDLQLPLYRHLLPAIDGLAFAGGVRLGYVVIPKDVSKVGDRLASWSEEDLRDADEAARNVIRQIRKRVFWPPNREAKHFAEFAGICPDALLEEELLVAN